VYRKADAGTGRVLAAPVRIVVAIAAPDAGGGPVLDYERELRNVLAAVRAARQDAADVRVVPFATVAAIREELDRGPAHVLHISGHGSPGTLALENDDGSARPVTADEFADQAIPLGQMPPVVVLSACYTDAAGSEGGASFAARLCQLGAAAVIATETSITDRYAHPAAGPGLRRPRPGQPPRRHRRPGHRPPRGPGRTGNLPRPARHRAGRAR
jgi:hypothetical protein